MQLSDSKCIKNCFIESKISMKLMYSTSTRHAMVKGHNYQFLCHFCLCMPLIPPCIVPIHTSSFFPGACIFWKLRISLIEVDDAS